MPRTINFQYKSEPPGAGAIHLIARIHLQRQRGRALWFYGTLRRSWRRGVALGPPLDLCYRPAAVIY